MPTEIDDAEEEDRLTIESTDGNVIKLEFICKTVFNA